MKSTKIRIFETSIGNIAIFICKDFLRLNDIIPKWIMNNNVDFIIIPALTGKVLPFYSKLINLFNNIDLKHKKALNIIFNNIGEYGGSDCFSISRTFEIEKNFNTNRRDNLGEVIVVREIDYPFLILAKFIVEINLPMEIIPLHSCDIDTLMREAIIHYKE